MALPDELAHEHWLAKLPRGRTDDDLLVHRNEAAYLQLAHACGLRTNEPPKLLGNILLVRRFDRVVHQGVLHRLHQESAASLCDLRGFGLPTTQQDLHGHPQVVDKPLQETIEFIRRDVLNQAMRNTDNHARNTAVQRTVDGVVQLTPLFDFAPMYKDPEIIARSCHWVSKGGDRLQTWEEVIDTLPVDDSERDQIAAALADFAPIVGNLPELARQAGVDPQLVEDCRKTIDRQAQQLSRLKGARHG
jgi:serine/threonine-protein kinase HipA